MENGKPPRLIRMAEVCQRVTLSQSTIYKLLRADPPEFPLPRRIGGQAVAWIESEIDAWIETRATANLDEWLTPKRKADLQAVRKAKQAARKAVQS